MSRLDSFEDAQALRENWDSLVERVGGDVFATFDWCSIWWRHFGHGRKPALFVAHRDEALVGVWPLFRETLRWGPVGLRVVRVVGCDHGVTTCNVTTTPSAVRPMAQAVIAALDNEDPWDLLHIGEIPAYADAESLAEAFRHSCGVGEVKCEDDVYPHALFEMNGGYEKWLSTLSLKERRNVRRDDRQLARRCAWEHAPADEIQLTRALDDLIALHRAHWKARGRRGHFEDVPGVEAFHRDVARAALRSGRLALVEIKEQGRTIASEYALRFNGRVHWIIGGRQQDTSARVGFCALVRHAILDRMMLIDGLPGAYDYKRRLGARFPGIKTISVFPSGKRGALRRTLARSITQFFSFTYHRAWFWHLSPWLALRMPHIFERWVRPGLWERFARSRFLVVRPPKRRRMETRGPCEDSC